MRLKELRKQNKLTLEEVSEKININRHTYNSYELGKREPSIETLCKIADFYNVTLDYLVGRDFSNEIGYLTEDQRNAVYALKLLNEKNLKVVLSEILKLVDEQ